MSTEQTEDVKMVVDEDKCIGAGQCELLEEETFYVDDDTVIAQVIGTGMLPKDRAQKVVSACPSQAISFTEVGASGDAAAGASEDAAETSEGEAAGASAEVASEEE